MSIVLPEPQAETVRQRAAECGMTPEEYLAALVEADAAEAAVPLGLTDEDRKRIGDVVLERLDSGRPGIVVHDAFWDDVRRRGRERGETRRADAS
jgi:hypothetical protein